MKKEVIFIDLDGTIFDVSKRIYRLYREILKENNKKFISEKDYLRLKRQKKDIKEILIKTEAEDILKKFKKEWKKNIESQNFLKFDSISLSTRKKLFDLKKNYKLILVTLRNNPKSLNIQLKKEGIKEIFDKILVKSPENHKLKWKTKYQIIKKYGNYNKKSIIIGDTETDILAGKALGIKTVAVTSGMRDKEFLKKYKPDLLIKNIIEI